MTLKPKIGLFVALCVLAPLGCAPNRPRGVVYTTSINSNITNGKAFERATVVLQPGSTLVLPTGTPVVVDESISSIELTVIKELAVFGHPPEKISIDEMRTTLGVAQKTTADTIYIATYGEYSIENHGGATVTISARVPQGTKWEFRETLSGPKSETGMRHKPLAPGWTRLESAAIDAPNE